MKNTSKKNQHYIPKFYLRNFSYQNNQTQIGVYNINNSIYHQTAPLKHQGSKKFFYGHDGAIEDYLSDLEGDLATEIKNILQTLNIPVPNSEGHIQLACFATLTHLRNPIHINSIEKTRETMVKFSNEMDTSRNYDQLIPKLSRAQSIQIALKHLNTCITTINDLKYKLLINETSTPFITSDLPVIRYNKFLEAKKWSHGKTGFGSLGLQLFIPLSPTVMLTFYDSEIYKVGHKKKKTHSIYKKSDVDQLNLLQFLNCYETIFFNETATENYIKSIHEKAKKFNRANEDVSRLSVLLNGITQLDKITSKTKPNLVIKSSTDCEINLDLEGLKIHSKSRKVDFGDRAAQLRPWASFVLSLQNNTPTRYQIQEKSESQNDVSS